MKKKEHCPRRMAGEDLPRHLPCDTGDFSRDVTVTLVCDNGHEQNRGGLCGKCKAPVREVAS